MIKNISKPTSAKARLGSTERWQPIIGGPIVLSAVSSAVEPSAGVHNAKYAASPDQILCVCRQNCQRRTMVCLVYDGAVTKANPERIGRGQWPFPLALTLAHGSKLYIGCPRIIRTGSFSRFSLLRWTSNVAATKICLNTHQESKLRATLSPSQYIIPFSH